MEIEDGVSGMHVKEEDPLDKFMRQLEGDLSTHPSTTSPSEISLDEKWFQKRQRQMAEDRQAHMARRQEAAGKSQFVSMSLGELRHQSVQEVLKIPTAMVKSTQMGEVEPSDEEKKTILYNILDSHPATFLRRFGMLLHFDLLVAFESHLRDSDFEARYCISQLRQAMVSVAHQNIQRTGVAEPQPSSTGLDRWQKRIQPTVLNGVLPSSQRVKNRRFRKMQELLSLGEYFNLAAMRLRSPALYDQYFPQSHAEPGSQLPYSVQSQLCKESDNIVEISDILLKAYDHDQLSKRKKAEENAWAGIKEADVVMEDAGCDHNEESFSGLQHRYFQGMSNVEIKGQEFDAAEEQDVKGQADKGEIGMERDVEEDAEFQLREIMKRTFLDGLDSAFFDYDCVDFDWRLDDLEQEQRDIEETWFDED